MNIFLELYLGLLIVSALIYICTYWYLIFHHHNFVCCRSLVFSLLTFCNTFEIISFRNGSSPIEHHMANKLPQLIPNHCILFHFTGNSFSFLDCSFFLSLSLAILSGSYFPYFLYGMKTFTNIYHIQIHILETDHTSHWINCSGSRIKRTIKKNHHVKYFCTHINQRSILYFK